MIKIRLTQAEHERAIALGKQAGDLSKVVRAFLRSQPPPRARLPACQCRRLLQVLATHMHFLARRAQDIPNPHTVVEILERLVSIERLAHAALESTKP